MLVWRGGGIIVPILIFIIGWIVIWTTGIQDTSIGNAHFMGWTCFWSSIVITILGLGTVGMGVDQETGVRAWTHHTFFWIPMVIWGVGLGFLSGYLLIFRDKPEDPSPSSNAIAAPDTEGAGETTQPENKGRIVHFYNASNDTLFFEVADSAEVSEDDPDGVIERKKVPPHSTFEGSYAPGSYIFAGFTVGDGDITNLIPDKKAKKDDDRYEFFKGKDGKYAHRILGEPTKETDDYDEAWMSLDGKTGFMLVNVTSACEEGAAKDAILKADWTSAMAEEYPATDLVEPKYKKYIEGENVRVVGPGEKLPSKIGEKDNYYLLIPKVGKMDNKAIAQAIVKARF